MELFSQSVSQSVRHYSRTDPSEKKGNRIISTNINIVSLRLMNFSRKIKTN